jgi:hypothetical protein
MSLELSVVLPTVPEPEQVARLVGPLMCMVLRRPMVHALVDDDGELDWKLLWDGTRTVISAWPPGLHEWEDCWDLEVGLGERGIDASLLLMYVTAAAIAILGEGFLVDERNLISGGDLSGRKKSASDLLTLATGQGRDRSPQDVLSALGSDYWGEQ